LLCLAPAQQARPADAAEVAGRVKRYRDEVAARQAEAERLSWIRAAGEAFPPRGHRMATLRSPGSGVVRWPGGLGGMESNSLVGGKERTSPLFRSE
jgi:hypothetical protein